jgi:integrase
MSGEFKEKPGGRKIVADASYYIGTTQIRRRKTFDNTKEGRLRATAFVANFKIDKPKNAPKQPNLRTIEEMVTYYHEKVLLHVKESTADRRKKIIRSFLAWCSEKGIRYTYQFTDRAAQIYREHCIVEHRRGGLKLQLSVVSSFFTLDLKRGPQRSIQFHPFAEVKKSPVEKPLKKRAATTTELAALLSVCNEHEGAVVDLVYGGGLRPSEAQNLMWEHVEHDRFDLSNNPGWSPKTEHNPYVFRNSYTDRAIQYFARYSRDTPYVIFASNKTPSDKPVNKNYIGELLARVIKKAKAKYPDLNFTRLSPKALRKSYGKHLLDAGVPLGQVSDLMRHKYEWITEEYYAEYDLSNLSKSAQKLPSILPEISHNTTEI